jgi:hypothetical protein
MKTVFVLAALPASLLVQPSLTNQLSPEPNEVSSEKWPSTPIGGAIDRIRLLAPAGTDGCSGRNRNSRSNTLVHGRNDP